MVVVVVVMVVVVGRFEEGVDRQGRFSGGRSGGGGGIIGSFGGGGGRTRTRPLLPGAGRRGAGRIHFDRVAGRCCQL